MSVLANVGGGIPEQRQDVWRPAVESRQRQGRRWSVAFLGATLSAVLLLAVLVVVLTVRGWDWLSVHLITSMPSRVAERAGFNSAIWGSLWVVAGAAIFSFIVGVGSAIFLEEYAPRHWFTRILKTNIANLAGVPSVVYGLLGLALFVEILNAGRTVLAGALTMGLLILPIVILASQESLRAVPLSLRQAAFGLGGTRWQVVRHHVLPAAMPGILTGTILAVSRAIGETAPLIVVGAAAYFPFRPDGPLSQYTAMPVQIYQWTQRPQEEFQDLAAAAIIVLLVLLLGMNAVAIVIRQRLSTRKRW
ncbi:MAG: phosphate ABC transporter permease PstA [Chloroflexota bacterium]|nr:phosphate ABC transporter permease PstA [Chloroflexota bacterium]